MKLCRSLSPASRSRVPRVTAFALAGSGPAGVVEAHHADELAGDENRHDRFGLGADAFDTREHLARGHLVLAEADAATSAQLGAHGGEVALIAAARRGLRQRR